jgi:hypothetical protein
VNRAAAACALAMLAFAAPARALEPDALMKRLATVPASEARFTETRTSSLLKTPLVVSGRLVYRRPDRLEKHVQRPFVESTMIEGAKVTMSRGQGDTRTLTIPAGAAQALVESLRATLAGDLSALQRYFTVHVDGTIAAWTMTLVPRETELSGYVLHVEIAGEDARLRRIEVHEASGDRTVTVLEDGSK